MNYFVRLRVVLTFLVIWLGTPAFLVWWIGASSFYVIGVFTWIPALLITLYLEEINL